MAFWASSGVDMVTNANPLERPLMRSIIRLASTTVPWAPKASCRSFSVVLKERFPTNNLLLILVGCSIDRFSHRSRLPGFKSSLNEVHLKIYHVRKALLSHRHSETKALPYDSCKPIFRRF